jgi:hypothetical protein
MKEQIARLWTRMHAYFTDTPPADDTTLATQPTMPAVATDGSDDPNATHFDTYEQRIIHTPEIAAARRRDSITTKGLILAGILSVVVLCGVLFAVRGLADTPPAPHYVGWLYVSKDHHTVVWVQRVPMTHFVSGEIEFLATVTTVTHGKRHAITYTLFGVVPADGVTYVLSFAAHGTYTADLTMTARISGYNPGGAAVLVLNFVTPVSYAMTPATDAQHAAALGGL